MFFPGKILYKINGFSVRGEKIFDVHTKDRIIRKEISPRTKASSEKASLFEWDRKIAPAKYLSRLSLKYNKSDTIPYIYIYIYKYIYI